MASAGGLLKQLLNISHLQEVIDVLKKYQYTETSYYQLGFSLGLSARTLDNIKAKYRVDISHCLLEVLKKWLKLADNVKSKGGDGPSYYTLIAALRAIGENGVADGIDREKHPACVILAHHQSDQSLQDSLPTLSKMLHKEGIIDEKICTIGGTEAMLTAVQEAVYLNYVNLEKFAAVLQSFPSTASVGDAILEDYKNEFPVDVHNDENIKAREAKLVTKQGDDYKVRSPKNIEELLRSVGVVIYWDDDLISSRQYKSYSSFNCKLLKELISNPSIMVNVQPFLFSLCGLPRSGKTAAFTSFMTHHVYGNPFLPPDMKIRPRAAVDDVAHHDLIAVPDANADCGLLITEATKEFSCVIGILSAFKQLLSTEGRVPFLDPNDAPPLKVFQKPELNEWLQYMYQYIGSSFSELGDEGKASYADKLSIYPEENALINIWDIPNSSIVHDILLALQGHLTNNHMALFLHLERDLDKLRKPLRVDHEDLMEWCPRIHYLLHTCRMSEEEGENRKGVCTIFAKYDSDFSDEELQVKITELQEKVQSAAQEVGVSQLLDYNIETVGLKGFQDRHQKIKKMISKTQVEEIPIAWLFLRSLFHLSSEVFRHKDELKALAEECGMDDSSLKRFGKFYTSFGSIFDLSLVNPDAQYVIVKPIHFLKKVKKLFSSKHNKFPTMAYGIVPASVGSEVFEKDWPAYIDVLVCLNLATEIAIGSIEMPSGSPPLDPNDTYYFISSCRTGPSVKDIDPNSMHLITGINTPVVFNQVTFTRFLLNSQPQCRLVACTNRNQTIIRDTSTDTTVTFVNYGTATKLHLSKASRDLCSDVVQAYHDMANNIPVTSTVECKFAKMCVKDNTTDPLNLSSASFHFFPDDKLVCKQCQLAGRLDAKLTNVWNEALKKVSLFTKHDRKYLRKAFESGCVKAKISKAVVQGPARAGKTSLKCLIINEPYESNESTGIVEPPCIAINISKYGSNDGTNWKLVTDDEMLTEAVHISKHYEEKKKKRKNEQERKYSAGAHDSRSETLTSTAHSGGIPSKSATSAVSTVQQMSQSFFMKDSPELVSKQSAKATTIRLPQTVAHDIMKKAKEEMEKILISVPNDPDKTIHKEWLYFIDSGGQIQFQRLLHAFLPCASVLLLVTNLAEGFADQSSTIMQLDDGAHSVSEYAPTNEELLEQLIIMVDACSEQQRKIIERDPELSEKIKPPLKLHVMAVATHLDEIETGQMKKKLKEKHEKFREILRSMKDNLICPNYHNSEIFYIIDGRKAMKEGAGTQDSVVQKICEELRKQAFEISIPLRWYAFEILLRKTAESFHGVLTLDVCKAIGSKELNMEPNEVKSALKFFYLLNTMLYYPESKAPDLIFADPQHLFNLITELAIAIVKIRSKESVGEGTASATEFAHMGIISKEFVAISKTSRKILDICNIPDFSSDLLLLFEYLMIAKTVPAAEYGEGKFFMPALLPLSKHFERSQSADSPFVFRFKMSAPIGFFCTFIIHLLSSHNEEEPDWLIPPLHARVNLSSNYIVLRGRKLDMCDIRFLEHRDRYEVYCDESEHRVALREQLTDAMNWLVKDKKFSKEKKPEPALYCPCGQSNVPHTATIETQGAPLLCKGDYLKRVKYDKHKNGSHSCWSWLFSASTRMCTSLHRRLNEEPIHVDLVNCLVSIAYRWKDLGIALQLETNDLESARNESSNEMRLSCVLKCWKKHTSPPYTWATILDIISGPFINNERLRENIEKFLETEKAAATDDTRGIEEVDTHRAQQESISQQSSFPTATEEDKRSQTVMEATDQPTASLESVSFCEQNKKLLRDYSVDQICDLLDNIGLKQYKELFKQMEVNGRTFFRLTDDDLQDADQFNMKNKFHRKIVMEIVNGAELVANQ